MKALQGTLLALGYELPRWGADGDFGEESLAAYRTACYDYEARAGIGLDDDVEDDLATAAMIGFLADQAQQQAEQTSIDTVGVWVGGKSLRHPGASVDAMLKSNINRAVVICDDHSRERAELPAYALRPEGADAIVGFSQRCLGAGIEPALMWWPMPHEGYIRSAAEVLVPLADRCKATAIEADAEEPYTQAKNPMPYDEAAELIAELLRREIRTGASLARPRVGANAIGYTPPKIFGPLAKVCDYTTIQGYLTSTQQIFDAPAKFFRRWEKEFGVTPQNVVMGLAGYRQSGIRGHSPTTAVRHSLDSTISVGVRSVCYWWLQSILANEEVARVVRGILGQRTVALA